MSDARRLQDQLEQARRDLAGLAEQVDAGELDDVTAARLRSMYEAEETGALAGLADLGVAAGEATDTSDAETDSAARSDAESASLFGRSRNRVIAGTAIILIGLVAAIFAVTRSSEPRPGTAAPTSTAASGDPMASVTNEDLEAVVAANPEVVGMRAALAMRYFEERNLPKAIEHQTIVADLEPTADSLTILGLFEFEGGASTDAAAHLEAALDLDPSYAPALWYLANVYLYGLDDGPAALPVLEELGAVEGLPDDIAHAVEEMIPIARGEEPAP